MKKKKRNSFLLFLFVGWTAWIFFFPAGISAQEETGNIRYEIWVTLDNQNKMLLGKENITWFNRTRDEIHDIWFHLYYNAFKNQESSVFQESREERLLGIKVKEGEWGWIDILSIKLSDGQDLKPSMEFVTKDEPIHPGDQTVMRVKLPEPLKPGKEVKLHIEFQSKIPRTILRSGYYRNSYFVAQWFPKPGVYEEGKGWNCHEYHLSSEFFADFAEFKVHITVPENFVVGASGKQIGAEPDKSKRTVTYTFQEKNIHDFAWTADPRFVKVERDFIADQEVNPEEYEKISQKLRIPVEDIKLNNVKMILLIESEHRGQIERHFKALRRALKYYGLWYGPYPYETITLVDPPFRTDSGGMEYPTLFTAGTSILRSKKVLSPEGVIIHEFGHGYWYGLCANNEFEEAWLDEGINTYSTGKVLEKAYGQGVFSVFPLSINGIPLAWFLRFPSYYDYELDRLGAINIVRFDPITTFSWKFYSRGSYGLNVYFRASTCLHTLERLVGEEMMLRIMRTFQMRFRYRHPITQDFIDVVNETTGRDFSWFFRELFFNTLNFDYGIGSLKSYEKQKYFRGIYDLMGKKVEYTEDKIEELEDREKLSARKEIYITEVKLRRYGEARVGGESNLKLKVVFEDGSEETRFWDGQKRWENFIFEKKAKAKYAQIDPENIWLVDSNLTNNSLKLKRTRSGVFRLTTRILFWVQNALQLASIWS